MALYRFSGDGISRVERESFSQLRISERYDLQRVLRNHIETVSEGTLVISEEFSDWEDSRRRIDLLGIDRDGNLVVIELKRSEDGGHMDLQAVRYAAMVSALAFDRIVSIFGRYLKASGQDGEAERLLLDHLGWESAEDGEIGGAVKIVLVASDFNPEITTTVLWLNDQGLDIRCVRLIPYKISEQILLDVQQVIPLPETADYMVRLREKKDEERKLAGKRQQNRDLTKFTIATPTGTSLNLAKRRAILRIVRELIAQGIHPDEIQAALPENQPVRFHRVSGILEGGAFLNAARARAEQEGTAFEPLNWFRDPGEFFEVGGDSFVFSKRWGSRTEECMNALVSAFPHCGISFVSARNDEAAEP